MNREQELEFLIENKIRMVTILESDVTGHQNELDDLRIDEIRNNINLVRDYQLK